MRIALILVCMALTTGRFSSAYAQMLRTTTPFQQIGDSYSSGLGISWGLRGPGWNFRFPGGLPGLGGGNPNAGLSGGFAGQSGNVSGQIGFSWYQSSNRFNSVTAPSVTALDGYPASISSGTVRPFVIGITPVVGAHPVGNDQIRQAGLIRQQATLQSIAAKKARVRDDKALEYWTRGQRAEQSGNLKMARANYRLALSKASEPLRSEVIAHMVKHGWLGR